jgi:hypothetical protein
MKKIRNMGHHLLSFADLFDDFLTQTINYCGTVTPNKNNAYWKETERW